MSMEIPNILTFLSCLITFSVVKLFNGLRSRVRVLMPYVLNRAGYVDREGEGSTGPSRGEHRLTVYRAHASGCSSKSVNSIDSGQIFVASLGQKLSRNVFVVSILSFWRKLSVRKSFFHDTEKVEIFMKS